MNPLLSIAYEEEILRARRQVFLLSVVDTALLICHEIDSARWLEWELVHLPGGGRVFVALHLPLVALVLIGVVAVATGHRWARAFSLSTGFLGLAAGTFHLLLLGCGDPKFRDPLSVAVILGIGLASLALLAADARTERVGRAPERSVSAPGAAGPQVSTAASTRSDHPSDFPYTTAPHRGWVDRPSQRGRTSVRHRQHKTSKTNRGSGAGSTQFRHSPCSRTDRPLERPGERRR